MQATSIFVNSRPESNTATWLCVHAKSPDEHWYKRAPRWVLAFLLPALAASSKPQSSIRHIVHHCPSVHAQPIDSTGSILNTRRFEPHLHDTCNLSRACFASSLTCGVTGKHGGLQMHRSAKCTVQGLPWQCTSTPRRCATGTRSTAYATPHNQPPHGTTTHGPTATPLLCNKDTHAHICTLLHCSCAFRVIRAWVTPQPSLSPPRQIP